MRKALALALCFILILSALSGCSTPPGEIIDEIIGHDGGGSLSAPTASMSAEAGENLVRAAVLYNSADNDGAWEDALSRMEQPLLLGFEAEAVDVAGDWSLEGYDLLYPDESVMSAENASAVRDAIVSFAEAGGGVFLKNGFHDFFDRDFLGAKSIQKLEGYPYELDYPEQGEDATELQDIIRDYHELCRYYGEIEELVTLDYGYGIVPSDAVSLAESFGVALYSVNEYGKGFVFFANPMLPAEYFITGLGLESRSAEQKSLADSSMGATRLIENAFASFFLKRTMGFSVWRVYGCMGRPGMTWELHFEEMTGFENGSGIDFGELCKEYGQVPSYTLIRSSYTWFLRAESVTSLLGETEGALSFEMDMAESAYSSGTHAVSDGKWLTLAEIADGGSYFTDYPELTQRAFPSAADLDGDGDIDLIVGSSDGALYYYEGLPYKDRLVTKAAAPVLDNEGNAIAVAGYSAPSLADVDGDGILDILCGAADGRVYLYAGLGDGTYEPRGVVADTGFAGQVFPEAGDLNGDGFLDLVCGGNSGRILLWYGSEAGFAQGAAKEIAVFGVSGDWLAPRIWQLDGDGIADLAVGTADGYVARLLGDGEGGFVSGGFLECAEMNYKGNHYLKFGSNCVPLFTDINGDGATDIICGSLEYGMAYPIDSEYFPHRQQLSAAISYIKNNGFYLGVHFYTNEYASPRRERAELDAHLRAMNGYGAGLGQYLGSNQHTWYTSTLDIRQSFLSLWEAGLLWNDGYTPANNSSNYPQASAQNVLSLPFYLISGGEKTILLQNCSTLLYSDSVWPDMTAKYGLPVYVYYHCDFTHVKPEDSRAAVESVETFRRAHNYGFVMEDQLMLATAAAENMTLDISGEAGETFVATLSAGVKSIDHKLYSGSFRGGVGARISLGEALADKTFATDASVWSREGNELYISLEKDVHIFESETEQTGPHLINVNLPAAIALSDTGALINFAEGGMMQVTVSGPASTQTKGWTATEYEGLTMFTKYGEAGSLTIAWAT